MDVNCDRNSNVTLKQKLPSIFHPGLREIDSAVVCVHESIKYEVVCTKANLCQKIIRETTSRNPCFIVVCMYVSPSFKLSSILNELEKLLNDNSSFTGCTVYIVGDKNLDVLKQNTLSSFYSNFLQKNGNTQPLETATRINKDSATLIDQVIHIHFTDNPDCGILHDGFTHHFATFVRLLFSCKESW